MLSTVLCGEVLVWLLITLSLHRNLMNCPVQIIEETRESGFN